MSFEAGSVFSIPADPGHAAETASRRRGGKAEPTRLVPIRDRELRLAVMRAERAWAERYAPHLLKEWTNA